jgi:hypothetical protein
MKEIDDAISNAVASNKLEENDLTVEELKIIKESLINNEDSEEFIEKTIKFVKSGNNE